MTDGLNSVNDLEENRNWFVLRLWAIVYTIVFLFAVVFTLVVLVFGNTLHDLAVEYIPLLQSITDLIVKFRGFVLFGILFVFFDIIFTMLPNKKLTFKSQIPGAAICAVAWYVFCTVHLCGLFQWLFHVWKSDNDCTDHALAVFLYVYYDDECRSERNLQ